MKAKQTTFSSCCGAEPKNYNNDCDSSDFGICPECGDHCTYEEYDDDGEPLNEAAREFTAQQLEIIEQMQKESEEQETEP